MFDRRELIKNTTLGVFGSIFSVDSAFNKLSVLDDQTHLLVAKHAKNLRERKILKIMLPEGSESNIEPVANLFTQLTGTEIHIVSVPVDSVITEMLLATNENKSKFDIALPATFGISDLAESGVILKLNEFKKKYEPENFSKHSLYSLGDFYLGDFYGYQADGDVYLMFYNQLLLKNDEDKRYEDKFGMAYNVPSIWQELDRQMEFFHRPDAGQYGGALFRTPDYLVWEWWVRFHAKGLLPLDDELVPRINEDGGVEALEELIAVSQYLYPDAHVNGLFENWKSYSKGNIYANIGWGGTQKYLNQENSVVRKKLKYASTPGGSVNGRLIDFSYFNWGWNYTVSSKTSTPELAYLFTLFASSPLPSTLAVRAAEGFFDPYQEEHYKDKVIEDTYSPSFLNAHHSSMKKCIPDFYLSGQAAYIQDLRKYLYMAYEGDLKPKRALDLASQSWQILHRKYNLEKQKEQWLLLKESYPKKMWEY